MGIVVPAAGDPSAASAGQLFPTACDPFEVVVVPAPATTDPHESGARRLRDQFYGHRRRLAPGVIVAPLTPHLAPLWPLIPQRCDIHVGRARVGGVAIVVASVERAGGDEAG